MHLFSRTYFDENERKMSSVLARFEEISIFQ